MAENIIYNWSFNSKKDRGVVWYSIALSVVIGLVIWGFLTKQYMMSFVILLITGLVYYTDNNSEDIINVEITELGIKIDTTFYDFGIISAFTLIYEKEYAVYLRLHLLKKGIRYVDLNIDNGIAKELKNILPNFMNETPKVDLTMTEKIIHLLKL